MTPNKDRKPPEAVTVKPPVPVILPDSVMMPLPLGTKVGVKPALVIPPPSANVLPLLEPNVLAAASVIAPL